MTSDTGDSVASYLRHPGNRSEAQVLRDPLVMYRRAGPALASTAAPPQIRRTAAAMGVAKVAVASLAHSAGDRRSSIGAERQSPSRDKKAFGTVIPEGERT